MTKTTFVAAVDLGGTNMAVALGACTPKPFRFTILSTQRASSGSGIPAEMLHWVVSSLGKLLAESRLTINDLAGIGISCGGPLDTKKGLILSPPNLPRWKRVNVVERIRAGLGAPATLPVVLENDANAIAKAEMVFGGARTMTTFCASTLSSGVGGGIIIDGEVFRGSFDNAGEYGQQVFNFSGTLFADRMTADEILSAPVLARLAKEIATRREDSSVWRFVRMLGKRTPQTPETVMEEFVTHFLAVYLANLANIYNPRAITISGGVLDYLPRRIVQGGLKKRIAAMVMDSSFVRSTRLVTGGKGAHNPTSDVALAVDFGDAVRGRWYRGGKPFLRKGANNFGRVIINIGGTNAVGSKTVEQLASANGMKKLLKDAWQNVENSFLFRYNAGRLSVSDIKRSAIYTLAKKKGGAGGFLDAIDGEIIFTARRQGDVLACVLVRNCARFFGRGISTFINLFNPEGFFVGGGLTRSWRTLAPMIRAEVSRNAGERYPAAAVKRSHLRNDVGLYSAFAVLV